MCWLERAGYVIGRESNVVLVDFRREPDPPAPKFPGASGAREINADECEQHVLPLPSGFTQRLRPAAA